MQPTVEGPRQVQLLKTAEGYGFAIGGCAPTHVVSVDQDSSASRSGAQPQMYM